MSLISLIHPSRGRASKSYQNAIEWTEELIRYGIDYELIVSLDEDDKELNAYKLLYGSPNVKWIVNQNKSLVEATNAAAKEAKGDILVYLSDDFKCYTNWGRWIINEFNKYQGQPALIKVDDLLQDFYVQVLTIPIMNRACYEALGYFFHPDFKSMHCDEHLYHRAKKLGFLKFAPHIKFEHQHVSVGKAQDDDTYRRSAANWNHGKETLAKHRRLGFTQ